MFDLDRSKAEKFTSHEEAEWDGFVEDATPEERFLMVWELTKNLFIFQAAKEGSDEPEFLTQGLQRHIIDFSEVQG